MKMRKMTKLKQKLQITVWHEIFAGSNFCDFSSHPRQKQLANKNFLKHFSRKNLLQSSASVNSSCAQPSSSQPLPLPDLLRGICPALSVPGVGHLQILRCPGAGNLSTPGPTPSFWHARGFLLEYNHTEDFTGKTSRLAPLSRTAKKLKRFNL